MPQFIDRRWNPKDKSLGNRQRFLRRAREQIKEAVDKATRERSVTDAGRGGSVSIPTRGIGEPRLRHSGSTGRHERVLPGNREFETGDQLPKPQGGGGGEGGREAADRGDGQDDFEFELSREEFLDLLFEDLELPDLVKTSLKEVYTWKQQRAGFTTSGTANNLNVLRTMRNSFGRRIALNRPNEAAVEAIKAEIFGLEAKSSPSAEERERLTALHGQLGEALKRRKAIPFIDPLDVRYNRFEQRTQPNAKAVMFCLMDVSGSMGAREKDLAKRFFVLLHLFLQRRYDRIEVVFIRHTHEAQEVDEQAFFHSRETGGTVVSTALVEMQRVLRERYPSDEWNIYAAQASDGENYAGDSERCAALLQSEIMPLCQYFAYVEILDEREMEIFRDARVGAALWRAYRTVQENWGNFAMKRIARPQDIYPVFRELFQRQQQRATA